MKEFDLIKNYFATQALRRPDVLCGIGDDAALVQPPENTILAITTDTLVSGVHFFSNTHPEDIGYKAIAVSLSDLAAMGATPAWVLLTLTLPEAQETWIQSFCNGFFTLANRYQVELIGGDLTKGPLSITVQAIGLLPNDKQLLRSTAKPADLIYVTGSIGDAGLAISMLQQNISPAESDRQYFMNRLNRPEPRVNVGKQLIKIANSAIDISDGLAADLTHILEASGVGASVCVDQLPLSFELQSSVPKEKAIELALTSGDDYEICFTIPQEKCAELDKLLSALPCKYTCIGKIKEEPGLEFNYQNGMTYRGSVKGYQHF